MNFKEALIAHLQGEKVEVKTIGFHEPWEPLFNRISNFTIRDVLSDNCGMGCEFRLALRTIFVNGVEVPAPESVAPECGSEYFLPSYGYSDCLHDDLAWTGHEFDFRSLERGLVYLNKEDAIARAKAMLLCK